MDFALDRPLPDAYWEIKFVVDSVNKRHEIALGATDRRDYPSGVSSMQFQVPRISVEGIMPCELANTGLLVAALKSPSAAYAITDSHLQKQRGNGREEEATLRENYDCGGGGGGTEEKGDMSGEVAAVNLVVQVSDAGRGRLVRCIYSPLE